MVMTVLIVDDELLARTRLRTLLGDCTHPATRVEAEAANAAQALAWLSHHSVDVALIDINMPGANGMTLVTSLRTLPNPPAILFVTAHAEHALQAFELDAVDYLTKPVRLERLQVALQKVERLSQSSRALESDLVEDFLLIQERGRAERVKVSDVLYFKAELKYVTVRTLAHSYLLETSLNELEEQYHDRFMRIHRNALIARRAVRALERHHDADEGEGWAVRLDGVDEMLFVSRRQLAAVREMMTGAA
jgi:two-component system, LytTR family, response regulator AlgR